MRGRAVASSLSVRTKTYLIGGHHIPLLFVYLPVTRSRDVVAVRRKEEEGVERGVEGHKDKKHTDFITTTLWAMHKSTLYETPSSDFHVNS